MDQVHPIALISRTVARKAYYCIVLSLYLLYLVYAKLIFSNHSINCLPNFNHLLRSSDLNRKSNQLSSLLRKHWYQKYALLAICFLTINSNLEILLIGANLEWIDVIYRSRVRNVYLAITIYLSIVFILHPSISQYIPEAALGFD